MIKKYAPLVLVTLATLWVANRVEPVKKIVYA